MLLLSTVLPSDPEVNHQLHFALLHRVAVVDVLLHKADWTSRDVLVGGACPISDYANVTAEGAVEADITLLLT
jgi:hypothetical protein